MKKRVDEHATHPDMRDNENGRAKTRPYISNVDTPCGEVFVLYLCLCSESLELIWNEDTRNIIVQSSLHSQRFRNFLYPQRFRKSQHSQHPQNFLHFRRSQSFLQSQRSRRSPRSTYPFPV